MPLKPTTDPSSLSFPDEEVKTLAFWEEIDAFQTALKLSEGKPEYTFYDGPPFATGTPHYGHILAGTIKDTMTRYAHQNGFHVPRRFGWDCHGLPIEFEIDKQEGIKTRDDVLAIGIDKYNEMCRSIVMRFSAEWKTTVTRLGRWIDMENDYKTMDTNYMESVWWAFKTMFDKGYVYRGFKVMPYSTACGTPLSNFEAGMNYKDVNDPEVYVTFPLVDEPDVNLVAWTTTPWTLPSNLALCVNPEMDYVKIKDKKTEKIYIVAKARVTEGFYTVKKGAALPYDVLDEFKGAALEGRTYQPLFDYFVEQFKPQGAFKVLCDSYVTSTSGTGIVHQAPAFGEDDNRVCARYGVVIKGGEIPCPLDANGRFTAPVEDFKGEYIKDADKGIMAHLKKVGRLYKSGTIFHSYPFCWRSDTPLIYRAIPSWFVRVESIRERLIANNDSTYWVPSFVKDNRFKNWLADARDWAVSRNRFWGTPLPIWANDDYTEIVAIGSIDELEQLSGVRVTDLHRHNIDHITIPSKSGEGVLRRTSEIFDCWLESGCMPYAQLHYPFENKERFEAGFPADFIAEGIDQTRGWFYTLMVISTILFDRPPFKNVIVNGIVLNKEGKKMSKREKNYPDPNLVINSYGSDSLRLYLVNSPVVRGDDLKFDEAGVRAISRDVLRLWYSSYHFLVQSILQHEARTGSEFTPNLALSLESGNLMDKWILANLQSLIAFVDVELKAYHLYTVVPRLVAFLEELNNWYIKLNRPRLRGKNGEGECLGAVNALYEVLMTMCKAMAPFVPFITEHIYQNLRLCLPEDQRLQSVHFTSYPQPNELLVDKNMVENFKNLQAVINLGRTARERRTMPLRLPLKEVTIIHKSQEVVDNLQILVKYIEEGLSVSKVNLTTLEAEYVSYSISLNQRAVGKRLRAEKAKVEAAVKQLTQDQIRTYAVEQRIELEGHVLEGEDLIAVKVFNGNKEIMEADWDANFLIVLNLTVDRDQQMQCLARGTKNRVQRFRKKAGIKVGDDIVVYHQAKEDSDLSVAIDELSGFIQSEIGVPFLPFSQVPADATLSEPEVGEVEDIPLTLWIHKK